MSTRVATAVLEIRTDTTPFTGGLKSAASETVSFGAVVQRVSGLLSAFGKGFDTVTKGSQSMGKRAKEDGDAMSSAFQSAGTSFGKLVASFISAQAIIGAAKGLWNAVTGEISASIKAAGEAEKAHVQLAAALRAQGTAAPSVIAAYGDYASALERTTIFQDDALEGAAALLVTIGNVMPRDMKAALTATTELASGLGIDLTQAATMVAKAAEGQTGSLKKAGVIIDETKAKSEGFGAVLDAITDKFGGQAAAIAGTYEGRLAQLKNTWNNVEESIGRSITTNATVLEVIKLVTEAVSTNTGELRENNTAANLISGAVILAVRAYATLIDAINSIQSAYATLREASNVTFRSLVQVGIAALEAAKYFLIAQKYLNPAMWLGMKDGIDEVDDALIFMRGMVQGFNADTADAKNRSADWSDTLKRLSTQATEMADRLEKTRGKTVDLTLSTDESADAWKRQTQAAKDAAEAQKAIDKALADTLSRIADFQKEGQQSGKTVAAAFMGPQNVLRQMMLTLDLMQNKGQLVRIKIGIDDSDLKRLNQNLDSLSFGGNVGRLAPNLQGLRQELRGAQIDLSELSRAFSNLAQVSGDSFKGVPKDIATVITAIDTMDSAMTLLNDTVGAKGAATWVSYASAAATGYGAVMMGLGILFDYLSKKHAEQAARGRELTDALAGLQARVQGMWSGGTQFDTTSLAPIIEMLNQLAAMPTKTLLDMANLRQYSAEIDALLATLEKAKAGASKYGLSGAELKQAVEDAWAVFDYMRDSGDYTQEQLNAAYLDLQKALAAAGDEAAAAWVKAQEGVTAAASAAQKAIDDLVKTRDALMATYANEAPEEEMGSVEAAARSAVEAMNAQIAAQQAAMAEAAATSEELLDTTAYSAEEAFQRAADAIAAGMTTSADDSASAFSKAFGDLDLTVKVKVDWDTSGFPGAPTVRVPGMATPGTFSFQRPTLVAVGERGYEEAMFSGAGRGFGTSPSVNPMSTARMERLLEEANRELVALRTSLPRQVARQARWQSQLHPA